MLHPPETVLLRAEMQRTLLHSPDLLWGAGSHRRKVRKKRRALRPECDHLGQGGRLPFKGTDQ